jgi:hypothetical protein
MEKFRITLLVILGMLAWIALWVSLGLFGIGIDGKSIDSVSTYVRRMWFSWMQWLMNPRNAANALQWTVRVAALAAILFAYKIDPESWFDAYRGEIVGIAFTILVIEEVERLRNRLESKESVIRQMASRSNDFALDAARIAINEGWMNDGSLQGADLEEANLQNATLIEANLEGAYLNGANFQRAVLNGSKLQKAILTWAKLQNANLFGANLEGADLLGADLQKATLSLANLRGTNMLQADLQGAELKGADLQDAVLEGANLEDTNLHDAFVVNAKYNLSTNFPKDFNPTTAGMILVDELDETAA